MSKPQVKGTLTSMLTGYFLVNIEQKDSRENFKKSVMDMLSLLTKKEKINLMKRAQFCTEYQKLINTGKTERTINGIIARKFQLTRQNVPTYCNYCSFVWPK